MGVAYVSIGRIAATAPRSWHTVGSKRSSCRDRVAPVVHASLFSIFSSYARLKGQRRSDQALEAFRARDGPRALMLPIKTGSHGLNLVRRSFFRIHTAIVDGCKIHLETLGVFMYEGVFCVHMLYCE